MFFVMIRLTAVFYFKMDLNVLISFWFHPLQSYKINLDSFFSQDLEMKS